MKAESILKKKGEGNYWFKVLKKKLGEISEKRKLLIMSSKLLQFEQLSDNLFFDYQSSIVILIFGGYTSSYLYCFFMD